MFATFTNLHYNGFKGIGYGIKTVVMWVIANSSHSK